LLTGFEPVKRCVRNRDVEGAAREYPRRWFKVSDRSPGLLLEERLDVSPTYVDQAPAAVLRADDVLPDRPMHWAYEARLARNWSTHTHHLVDGASAVLRRPLVEAVPRAVSAT